MEFEVESPRKVGHTDTVETIEHPTKAYPADKGTLALAKPSKSSLGEGSCSQTEDDQDFEDFYYCVTSVPTISALYKEMSREAFGIDSSELHRDRSNKEGSIRDAKESESDDEYKIDDKKDLQKLKASAVYETNAITLPVLSAY